MLIKGSKTNMLDCLGLTSNISDTDRRELNFSSLNLYQVKSEINLGDASSERYWLTKNGTCLLKATNINLHFRVIQSFLQHIIRKQCL